MGRSTRAITQSMAYSSGMPSVLVGLAFMAFWFSCLFDAITTPVEEARNLPKILWVLIVLLLPLIGGLLWLLLGRPSGPRATRVPPMDPSAAPKGPDDDPEFLRDLNRRLHEED